MTSASVLARCGVIVIAQVAKTEAEVILSQNTKRRLGWPSAPLLKLPGEVWQAHRFNVPDDHGLKPGDHVRFQAVILNEGHVPVEGQ
jgi:hypothetical protein